MNKEELIENSREKLRKRFSDLDITFSQLTRTPIICVGGDVELWRIEIHSNHMVFRKGYELHDDLILLANDIRKEYWNVF